MKREGIVTYMRLYTAKPCADRNTNICVAEGCFAESCIKENNMRFTTIWDFTMPMALRERINRTLDLWAMCMADWLPKRAVYWITMRQLGRATMTSQNVPATSLDNVLTNLGNIKNGKPLEQFEWEVRIYRSLRRTS
jgi:hypothetical protein